MDHMTREALEASIMIRCPCCYGRGYQPERRRSGRGFYARTCRSCGGRGQRAPRKGALPLPTPLKEPKP